jgi:arginyl-tRNA synthetase
MKAALRSLIAEALERARASGDLAIDEIPEIHVEVPREQGHGDLASNVAMSLARSARKAPRAIAETILRHLHDPAGLVSRSEAAGPGFLNFTFSASAWRSRLLEIIGEGATYGSSALGRGKRIQVEFVSANPTGRDR